MIIHPAELINLHKIGFKLLPIGEDRKTPVIKTTPIYENPNYWTPEKLVQEASNFKNVATVFGQNITGKYINELDIDSQKVYDILFSSSAFIDNAIKNTYVVKTKKTSGYRIFWLSSKQNAPIHTPDCKPGYEFELKTDSSGGHSTLPPSRHRDDPEFEYKSYGQNKIFVQDDLYDKLLESLSTKCLRTEDETAYSAHFDEDSNIEELSKIICPLYKKGHRHSIVYGLSGLFHKSNIPKEFTMDFIQILAKDDEEASSRVMIVEETYSKDARIVSGIKYLMEVLAPLTANPKKIVGEIYRLIAKDTLILRLANAIMNEYHFKTMRDNREIYCYDGRNTFPTKNGESKNLLN